MVIELGVIKLLLMVVGLGFALSNTPVAAATGADGGTAYGTQTNPLADGSQLYIYEPGSNARLFEINKSTADALVVDHLSSVRLRVGATETVRYEYGPFGETAPRAGAAYAGHSMDAHQGIYLTPARGYVSALGRFLSVDPGRSDASPYPYAGLNPVTNVDPSGNVEVPFFLRSGFSATGNSNPYVSSLANSIKSAIDPVGARNVPRDDRFFSYMKEMTPGSQFKGDGRRLIRAEVGDGSYWHSDVLYWLVGNDPEVAVGRPLDVATVFAEWHAMRPGIASRVVIIDISGALDRSMPIRDALRGAGIAHGVVYAEVSPSAHTINTAFSFNVGGTLLGRSGFAGHVRSVANGLPPRVDMGESSTSITPSVVPEETLQSPLSDATTLTGGLTTGTPSVVGQPSDPPTPVSSLDQISSVRSRHLWDRQISMMDSDPMMTSASIGTIPVLEPAPLDSVVRVPVVRD